MGLNYKGIIFDLDGTLIKSTIDFVKMKQNMIKILEENGIPEGLLTPRQTTVVIIEKSENIWDENNKPESARIPVRLKLDVAMNNGELEAIPLVEEIDDSADGIGKLKEMGYHLTILTRSHHEYAVEALKKLKIFELFDHILGRGQTPKPKPYREALDFTAKLMNMDMKDLLFVGDHHIDYQSADNAGCAFIGVDTGRPGRDSWDGKIPKVLLKNVGELPDYLLRNM